MHVEVELRIRAVRHVVAREGVDERRFDPSASKGISASKATILVRWNCATL